MRVIINLKEKKINYRTLLYNIRTLSKISYVLKKTSFMGIGNAFRQVSQYRLMKKWEVEYFIRSAIEVPYDQATLGVDGIIFDFKAARAVSPDKVPSESYDLAWNFGFLQREPSLIYELRRISKCYVAAFVPNILNPGSLVHKLYHRIYKTPCFHPERGNPIYMVLKGLVDLFKRADLEIVEAGYMDVPPWPDTVVTLKELFGSKRRGTLRIPINVRTLITLMNVEEILKPRFIFAHHCYVFGRKKK